jgi:nucleotide-binding universal stress UspA family protein
VLDGKPSAKGGGAMFSTIVVGTDGSDTASAAVDLAVQIARQSKAQLHLVAAVASPGGVAVPLGGVGVGDPSSGAAYRRVAAEHMLEEVAGGIEGIDVQIHTGSGAPADVIVHTADEVGADLIVVGSKGMQGARRILGSVPNSVAHNSGCHVLIAKTT